MVKDVLGRSKDRERSQGLLGPKSDGRIFMSDQIHAKDAVFAFRQALGWTVMPPIGVGYRAGGPFPSSFRKDALSFGSF